MTDTIKSKIDEYSRMSYEELMGRMNKDNNFEVNEGGQIYDLEFIIVWEDKKNKVIRVGAFSNYIKKRWWQFFDTSLYGAIVNSNDQKSEWVSPLIKARLE